MGGYPRLYTDSDWGRITPIIPSLVRRDFYTREGVSQENNPLQYSPLKELSGSTPISRERNIRNTFRKGGSLESANTFKASISPQPLRTGCPHLFTRGDSALCPHNVRAHKCLSTAFYILGGQQLRLEGKHPSQQASSHNLVWTTSGVTSFSSN